VALMTPRTRDEWPDYDLYPALLAEAQRRGIEIVEVPHRFEGMRRSTPKRFRIELSRVPWNTFDVGLLVEAENTVSEGADALRNRPVIVVDLDATAHGLDSAAFMNTEAGAIAARYLLRLGHQNFAIMEECNAPGFAWDAAWTQRRHGFESALGKVGAQMLPRWRLAVPRQGPAETGREFYKHELSATVKAWMAEPPRRRPTAMYADSTAVAATVMQELKKFGLRVPSDFSIVTTTCNGRFWFAQEPVIDGLRMTSVDMDLTALVHRTYDAAEAVMTAGEAQAAGTARKPRLYLAPATLLVGESTAPPPTKSPAFKRH